MHYAQYNTATIITAGPFLSANDMSPLEALALHNGRMHQNDGFNFAFTPTSWGAGTDGYYTVGISGVILLQLGRLRLSWSSPGLYLPVWEDYMVMTPEAYDAWFASGAGSTDDIEFRVAMETV